MLWEKCFPFFQQCSSTMKYNKIDHKKTDFEHPTFWHLINQKNFTTFFFIIIHEISLKCLILSNIEIFNDFLFLVSFQNTFLQSLPKSNFISFIIKSKKKIFSGKTEKWKIPFKVLTMIIGRWPKNNICVRVIWNSLIKSLTTQFEQHNCK